MQKVLWRLAVKALMLPLIWKHSCMCSALQAFRENNIFQNFRALTLGLFSSPMQSPTLLHSSLLCTHFMVPSRDTLLPSVAHSQLPFFHSAMVPMVPFLSQNRSLVSLSVVTTVGTEWAVLVSWLEKQFLTELVSLITDFRNKSTAFHQLCYSL